MKACISFLKVDKKIGYDSWGTSSAGPIQFRTDDFVDVTVFCVFFYCVSAGG